MVNAGLWDDVDVNVSWHPSASTKADVQSSLALVDFKVEFLDKRHMPLPILGTEEVLPML